MIEELDINRTAKIYLDHYAGNALFRVLDRAETCREKGNENGRNLWYKIANAIEGIQTLTTMVHTTCH